MTDRPRDPFDPGTVTEDADTERDSGDAPDEAPVDAGDVDEEGEELDPLQAELDALNDRHLRLAAEFQNYRRRAEAERAQARTRAEVDLVRRLLDVLDDLQRVSALDPSDDAVSVQAVVEGVDLVERKFLRMLEDTGVQVIDPGGEPFDPETMEAMMRVPTDSPQEDDTVEQVLQKGYSLEGHLVRPARVSVRKHG